MDAPFKECLFQSFFFPRSSLPQPKVIGQTAEIKPLLFFYNAMASATTKRAQTCSITHIFFTDPYIQIYVTLHGDRVTTTEIAR